MTGGRINEVFHDQQPCHSYPAKNTRRFTILTLLLLLLPPLIGLVLIILGAIWAVNTLMDRVVGRKHHLMEEIITTGEIPSAWSTAKPGLFGQKAAFPNHQQKHIQKLDDLIRYARSTPLVSDEDAREILVAQLLEVRSDWSGGEQAEKVQSDAQSSVRDA